jgi:hypothetical protein
LTIAINSTIRFLKYLHIEYKENTRSLTSVNNSLSKDLLSVKCRLIQWKNIAYRKKKNHKASKQHKTYFELDMLTDNLDTKQQEFPLKNTWKAFNLCPRLCSVDLRRRWLHLVKKYEQKIQKYSQRRKALRSF